MAFTEEFSIPPTPITQESVTLFVAYLGAQRLSLSTIESYLAALRYFRILLDPSCTNPTFYSPHMKILLRGVRRMQTGPDGARQRLPITISLMRRIKAYLAQSPLSFNNRMIWAACCTGFFGFLRCAEFLVPDNASFDPSRHPTVGDVQLVQSTSLLLCRVMIKQSKTDQYGQGSQVVLGSTDQDICPVSAMIDYLTERGNQDGPLFITQERQPLRRSYFVQQVQTALSVQGLQGSKFNGHSFRIGAATSASTVGVPESTIKILGRWQSFAYQRYIRPSELELAKVSSQLTRGAIPPPTS